MKFNIIFIIMLNCSCNTTLNYNESENFFEFDEIVHYSINDNNQNANKDNDTFQNWYYRDFPNSLNDDLSSVSDLLNYGYNYNIIPFNKYSQINKIFSEKELREGRTIMCTPKYRDILFFRKNKKIVGIAKICFECEKCQIVGTKKNTISFYNPENFKKLYKILYGKEYKWNE